MCILFYHAKKFASPGKFRLILISNRDENLKRPTQQAQFWPECLDILAGRDLQPGADGGTWLAVNKKIGRIATLLNLANKAPNPSAVSRGHIVVDFVKDGSVDGKEYGNKLAASADMHNPFHFMTFEILPEDLRINYFAHLPSGGSMGPVDLSPANDENVSQSISNAPLATPLNKSKDGLKLFDKLVQDFDDISNKNKLVDQLIAFAKNETKFWPDSTLALRTDLEPQLINFSSIFVNVPEKSYGTRTHTVILVDDVGKVDFYESTLTDIGNGASEWKNTHESFELFF